MSFDRLPKEQARRAGELYQTLRDAADKALRAIAELLASMPDDRLFGETEFQLRDILHRVGARAAEIVLPRMSGLRVAESTVERAAEAAGA